MALAMSYKTLVPPSRYKISWIFISSFILGILCALPAPFFGNLFDLLLLSAPPLLLWILPAPQTKWCRWAGWFLLGFVTGHQWGSYRFVKHQASLLPEFELGQTFKIRAKVTRSWTSEQGPGSILTNIQILSPKPYPYSIQRLTAYFPSEMNALKRGTHLTTWITLKEQSSPKTIPWPMQSLWKTYLPRYSCSVKSPALILDFQEQKAAKPSPLNPGNQELLGLFLHGEPSHLWRDRLQPFGLGHLLAISGLHCLIVFLAIQAVCIPIRKPLLRITVSCMALLLFATHMGWSASVSRATSMLVIWTLLPAFNLPRRSFHLWALLLCFSLVWDPILILSQGFWYTFAASLGLLLGSQKLTRSPYLHPWRYRINPFLPLLGAQLLVLPVQILFGIHMPLAGFFWNLLGSLFLFVLLGLFLLSFLSSLLPGIAGIANAFEHGLSTGIEFLNNILPTMEWIRFPHTPVLVFIVLLCLSLTLRFGPREWRWYACFILLIVFSQTNKPQRGPSTHMLDIGQGLAILHVDPKGDGWLFDAGGRLPRGLAFSRILRLYGASRIASAFISHKNLDHYQLLRELDQSFPIIIPSGQEKLFREIEWLRASRTLISVKEGAFFEAGDLDLQILAPLHHQTPPNSNEGSIVVLATAPRGQLLLTGDAGHWLESRLSLPAPAPYRLLQVGHHGSKSATGDLLLASFRPAVALISAGKNNPFGHPHPHVLKRLREFNATVQVTAKAGSIRLEIHDP